MRILVTGKDGQLGKSIKKIVNNQNIYKSHDFVFIGKDEFNLTDIKSLNYYLDKTKFDILINCAAYTKVDKAEDEPSLAFSVNQTAVKEIAKIAKNNNICFIHISTDFVFDGLKDNPYNEYDYASPVNIYGETKLAGENDLLSIMKSNAIILRTSWIYSEYKNNFVNTILSLAKRNSTLNVVSDQIGTPTYASDLAEVILKIIDSNKFFGCSRPSEIFNFSNDGECSWFDFAREIIDFSGEDCTVNPILSEQYSQKAHRPRYTVLSKDKISNEFNLKIRYWKDALTICLNNL